MDVTLPCQASFNGTKDNAMIRSQSSQPDNPDLRASEDLRRAVGEHQLAEMVRAAVPSPPVPMPLPASSERLLALLTYSYAAGVYESSEIPNEIGDQDLSCLLGSPLPLDSQLLRRYRRHNRSELRDCLSRVLRHARTEATSMSSPDSWSAERCSHGAEDDFAAEADERINRAVRADTFALDD
jgi:hypothetical protein